MRKGELKTVLQVLAVVAALSVSFLSPATAVPPPPDYSTTNSPYVEGTDAAASMFDPLDVSEVKLTTTQETYDYFRDCCDWQFEGPWMPAQLTMTVKGVTVGPLNVGWHLKGAWGSWRNIDGKAGLKIRIDAFVKGQTIFGVKKLILNNMVQENSAMNQQLTLRVFRAMKVPASRTGYAHVTINDINFGLYTNIESLDRVSLARWFKTTKHLYKGGVPFHGLELIPQDEYALQVDTGSTTDRSDLWPLLDANISPDWWSEVQKVADIQEFLREWAVEYLMGHWDGYANNGNNFFIHSDENGYFTMLPWGVDNTVNGPMDFHYPNKIMARLCVETPECMHLYDQAIADASYTIQSLDLASEISQIAAVINPRLQLDPPERSEWSYDSRLGSQDWISGNVYSGGHWALESYYTDGVPEVVAFDSGLSEVHIGDNTVSIGGAETQLGNFTVPVGTRTIAAFAIPRQLQGSYSVTGNTSLSAGWNNVVFHSTSPNGVNTRSYTARVYVTSLKKATLTIKVSANGTLTKATTKALNRFASPITSHQLQSVVITTAGKKATRLARLALVKTRLRSAGISSIASATQKYSAKLKSDTVTITISYLA